MSELMSIQGAKAGQQQPKRPSIADDTIASISRLKMVIGLSEGEVKGLASGAASIMLEGTPLEDENGAANFEGVEWEIRHGTVDQNYIAGMPYASTEIAISTVVRNGTPWVRSISNTQLSSVNINISFPMLKKVTDKGDVVGVTVDYVIEVQTDGNGYTPIITKSLKAKTSGRYQRTHNVTLPEAQSNWQIRVRKITEDGDGETLFNTLQVDSIAEVIDGKFNYPHTAHLYLSFDARTFSNIPKVSVDMLGVYVQVPTNYDPETRTSVGIWQGQFKLGYTTNPAWHYYNLITNDRYGLGDKLQPFMIDKWSLEHIARICDEPVDDGKGGTEPRFECNLYLQKTEDAYQVLQHIAGIFRGMSFWTGSQIVVDADTPRDCEYVITRANVVGGHFSKTGSAASDRHSIAQVGWSNPDNGYETEHVMVRNERAIAQQGINILDLSAVGCTSEGQAYRMGLAALLAEQNRTQTVSFAMGLDGSLPTVGSRIDIPDMMFTGTNNGGRISVVSNDRQTITVDRDNVPAVAGDKLIVNLESGKAQTRVITAINGRAITVALAFDPVAPENVWSVTSDELPTMSFIVMSVVQSDDGTQYNYTALQYDASMYSQIDNGTIIEQRPPSPSLNPYVINAPEAITVTSRHRAAQGQTIATLVITWAQVKDAVAYDVEWRKDDGDWIKLSRTGNISAEVDGVYSGNYLARVRAISAFDAISKPTTSTLTAIAGKVGKPPKLLSLKATGILLGMTIDWTFAPGSDDTAYTEIQVASAPGVNVAPLGQFAYKTNTHTINGLQGGLTQYYRARIIDKLGNTSDWTNWISGTTDNSADKIIDLIQGQIDESALDQALRSEIGKIGTNKTLLDNVSIDVSKAKADIIAGASKADAAKASADANKVDLIAVNEAVANNKTAVDSSITTLTNKDISLTNLYTALQSEYATNKAKVTQDLKTLSDNDISFAQLLNALDSDYKGNKASVNQSLTTLTNKDIALTNSLNALTSTVGNNSAEITAAKNTITSNTQSIAQTKTDLTANFNNGIASLREDGRNLVVLSKIVTGLYVSHGDGALYPANAHVTTGFISIAELTRYTFSVFGGVIANARFVFYDANKAFISGELDIRNNALSYSTTSPKGARYIRVSGDTNTGATADKWKLEYGNSKTPWSSAPEDIEVGGKNLMSAGGVTLNYYIVHTTGNLAGSGVHATSPFVAIKPLNQYGISGGELGLRQMRIAFYDANKAFISGTYQAGYQGLVVPINAPIGASFVRFSAEYAPNGDYAKWSIESIGGAALANSAAIQTESIARSNADSAIASNVTTLQTTVNGQTASIQAQQQSINGLNAQYTLKIDVGGRISGFGLASSATQSEFAINADRFWIAPPTGTSRGKSPFMVLTSPQTINGTVVPAGTYMQAAFIHNGSIDTAKIKDASITTAKIDNLAVGAAQIKNGAIETAKIGNAQIDTLQIKGQAVSVMEALSKIIPTDQYGAYSVARNNYTTREIFKLLPIHLNTGGNLALLDLYFYDFEISNMASTSFVSITTFVDDVEQDSYRLGGNSRSETSVSFRGVVPAPNSNAKFEVAIAINNIGLVTARSYVFSVTSLKR